MKIFLCKGSFFGPVSGADQQLVNYAVHLKAAGHDPQVVITVPFASDDQYLLRLNGAAIPVRALGRHPHYLAQLGLRKLAGWFPFLGFLQKFRDWEASIERTAVFFLKRKRPDLVHVIAEGGLFIRSAHRAEVPVLYHEPAIPYYGDQANTRVLYEKLAACLPLCSELVGVSPRIAQLCRERMPCPAHVSVIPILVEDPAGSAAAPQERGTVNLGFAARIEALKGPMVLLEAFAAIAPRVSWARLLFAGTGDQEDELKQRVRELGLTETVEFVGTYIDEAGKRAFMESLDVLVHPSLAEGTPYTIVEAMAFGLPVIATAVGGVPDVVTTESGILVAANDVTGMARALEELATDPERRRQLGAGGRSRYEELFSPAAVVPVLVAKYESIVRRESDHRADVEPIHSLHPWAEIIA